MSRVLIIAEAGVNHNGSLENAKKLIDAAAEAGVDFVKFQTFKTENLVSKKAQKADYQKQNTGNETESQFEMLKKLELDVHTHQLLMEHCDKKGVKFLSTAFDHDSISLLTDLEIPFFKIPSGELTNKPYLEAIAKTKLPVIVSTGMANLDEVKAAVSVFREAGYVNNNIKVLHCNTEYPTPMEDVNLNAMLTIKNELGVEVGYSDHTLGIEVPIAAVAMGATVIEKHFTLDKNMEGPDHKASLEPHELKAMVKAIRNIEQAMGNGIKEPSKSERKNIQIARKSIHVNRDVRAGEVITLDDISMKRPFLGISPMDVDKVIGKQLVKDVHSDEPLNWEDLK